MTIDEIIRIHKSPKEAASFGIIPDENATIPKFYALYGVTRSQTKALRQILNACLKFGKINVAWKKESGNYKVYNNTPYNKNFH